jgi:hypothetical protein
VVRNDYGTFKDQWTVDATADRDLGH